MNVLLPYLNHLSQVMVLAQASSDKKPIVLAAVVVVALVLVFVIAKASRKNAEADPTPETPEVTQPDEHGPLTKPGQITDKRLDDRKVISTKDYQRLQALKDMGVLSPAQVKTFNLVKEEGGARRDTAVDHTSQSQAAHEDGSIDDIEIVDSDYKLVESILGSPLKVPEHLLPSDGEDSAPKQVKADPPEVDEEDAAPEPPKAEAPKDVEPEAKSISDGLEKTRGGFGGRFKGLFAQKKDTIDDDLLDEIEEFLFTADIGTKAAMEITEAIQEQAANKKNPEAVWEFVREYVHSMLKNLEVPLDVERSTPFVILVIGVNGAGKTTTIGKLASQYKRQGKEVMIVAGDTFRAAAVEQLEVWGDRANIPVHKGDSEADPASVVFDGIQRGVEEGVDVILCDTSGRLHNNTKLMDELAKISRVSGKAFDGAPHETILVLDANMGQNAIMQAKTFNEAMNITGIVLTKLDGTARGGVILAIDKELNVPVRYIGIGEGINDLRPFNADEFAEALFV